MFRSTFSKLALTSTFLLLGFVPLLHAQVSAEPRRALVIGNSAYPPDAHPLKNPVNDARAMGGALKDLGFDVTLKLDLTQAQMEDAIREFTGSLGQGSVAVFYYAGHGFQIEGINYLAPIDFYEDRLDASKLKRATVPVDDYVLRPMEKSGARLSLLILDACRNNPLPSSSRAVATNGLAPMEAARGSAVLFSAAAGQTADDNPNESNGIFTKHLLETLREPGLSLGEVTELVAEKVDKATNGRQQPSYYTQVVGRVVLNPGERRFLPSGDGNARPGPEITSLAASAMEIAPNENVTLQASATDPNADPLQYLWSSSAGRIEGSGSTAALSAGSLGTLSVGSQVTVTLTVKNSQGQQASRELVLNLRAPATVSPEALIGRAIPLGSGIEVWLEGRIAVEPGAASGSIEADLEKRENVWHVAQVRGSLPGKPVILAAECTNCTAGRIVQPSAEGKFLLARISIVPSNAQQPMKLRLRWETLSSNDKKRRP